MIKITLDTIATDLGISKTTVSRALSGKGRVSQATREKVIKYAEENGYRPNVMARGLAQQCTYNIAVVMPQEEDGAGDLAFFHKCLVGITKEAEKSGYNVILTVERGNRTNELEQIVKNSKADGVILTRTFFDDERIEYLQESDVPFVVIGSSDIDGVVQVDNDNYGGSLAMTDALIRHGRYPALFGGDGEMLVTSQRLEGFLQALMNNGMDTEEEAIYFLNTENGNAIPADIDIALSKGADCFICMDEEITMRVLEQCRAENVWIPQQIVLASLYDSQILQKENPQISAVSYDEIRLGQSAAHTLISMINKEEIPDVAANEFTLNMRASTE